MERPIRTKLPHGIPQWVSEDSFFFITINCVPRGRNQLCRKAAGDALLQGAAFYHERLQWHCRLMLLMPDHLHAVIAFPRMPGMATTVANWKKYHARQLGVSWQRDFFDHRLRDYHELNEKVDYILMNPARNKLCPRAEDWPWIYRGDAMNRTAG